LRKINIFIPVNKDFEPQYKTIDIMKRRDFVKSGMAFGTTALASSATLAASLTNHPKAAHQFKMKYAPHFGMFKESAGEDPIAQLRFMADQGFTALEDNGMMGRDVALQTKIGETLAQLNMTMGVFVVDKGGNGANSLAAGKPEYVDVFLDGCKRAVEVAKRVNAKWMTVVPGNFERNIPLDIQNAYVIEALRRGAEIFEPHGLVMVLEPLSDNPDLYLRTSGQTYMICKGVNSPSCKILYDIYHMQKNEGHLIHNIDLTWDEIAYFQIGDNPGRKEPTTGEINYKNVFKHIHEKGYDGIMGMEHGNAYPGKEGEQKLIDAYKEVDSFSI
jgi:hydroxypyruvate isomerase